MGSKQKHIVSAPDIRQYSGVYSPPGVAGEAGPEWEGTHSLQLDGVDEYATGPNILSSFDETNTLFGWGGWVKFDGSDLPRRKTIFSLWGGWGTNTSPKLVTNPFTLYFYFPISSSGGRQVVGVNGVDGWQHIICTKNSTNDGAMWINGAKYVGSTSFSGYTNDLTGDFFIGGRPSDGGQNPVMTTSDVFFIDGPIDDSLAADLYNSGINQDHRPALDASGYDYAYWPVLSTDDGTGTTGSLANYGNAGGTATPINTENTDIVADAPPTS